MKDFILDLVKRFLAKTPKFFKIIRIISIVLAVVTGLPELLQSAGVELSETIKAISSKVVSIASLIAAFIAQLTVTEEAKKDLNIK